MCSSFLLICILLARIRPDSVPNFRPDYVPKFRPDSVPNSVPIPCQFPPGFRAKIPAHLHIPCQIPSRFRTESSCISMFAKNIVPCGLRTESV